MSDLCQHKWKPIQHEGYNRVCANCKQLRKEPILANEPVCKKCNLLYAVETSIHPDYCDECYITQSNSG